MKYLLLGAGFTRNWGGWLANEIRGELCARLGGFPDLARDLRTTGNFEEILGRYRKFAADSVGRPGDYNRVLDNLEHAILMTFYEMNVALAIRNPDLSKSRRPGRSVGNFLAQFDAIFTLNQDIFLELNYQPRFKEFGAAKGRDGCYLPGVQMPADLDWHALSAELRAQSPLKVEDTLEEPTADENRQPIYKLHGSANWVTRAGRSAMVVGTGKEEAIDSSGVLRAYSKIFRERLCKDGSSVMVIGYSFADKHINDVLLAAGREHCLSMYVVDPAGFSLFDSNPALRNDITLRGISSRPLLETFGPDEEPSLDSFYSFVINAV